MKKGVILLFISFLAISIVLATTWFDAKVKCPVCDKTNDFQEIGSYGSYIYHWPEKLEYIFWPVTETYSLYSCKKCKYSAFMWDFNDIGKDTLELIKKELPLLNLSVSGYDDKMTIKLEAAEQIYKLYNKDADFWCWFYRIKGYHYEQEANIEKAKESRLTALNIADSLLVLPENANRYKELLLIISSMEYFTGQDSLALNNINKGLSCVYFNANIDSTENSNYNEYFDEILNELKMKIAEN